MKSIIIKNVLAVNRGKKFITDIFLNNNRIEKLESELNLKADIEINGEGLLAIPGIIDDQVHFREPGLTHKANIYTESRAAVAGGTTSFMEMPNTNPTATKQELLEEKYKIGANNSLANYSFFMGATNNNLEEVLKTNPKNVCGLKIFMGSSTGNMLVDNIPTLEKIFSNSPMLIATHCEDENTIRKNMAKYRDKYGENISFDKHPEIRSEEGCFISSNMAVELAKKHGSRLHILHISTADELTLFSNSQKLSDKKITAEVCVHHLYFNADDYDKYGAQIKCNPAIKAKKHQKALFKALLDDQLDIIATDHAPHTWEEKQNKYFSAPSGVPLVQHSLNVMIEFFHAGQISLEKIVEKMCHAPAECFKVCDRGFLDEGYFADVVLIDPTEKWKVNKENILYKCGWSPFIGHEFIGNVKSTIVNGHLAYHKGQFNNTRMGQRLIFKY